MAFKHKAAFFFTLVVTVSEMRCALSSQTRISQRSECTDTADISQTEDLFLKYTQHSWF
jgi:hypothetical protein